MKLFIKNVIVIEVAKMIFKIQNFSVDLIFEVTMTSSNKQSESFSTNILSEHTGVVNSRETPRANSDTFDYSNKKLIGRQRLFCQFPPSSSVTSKNKAISILNVYFSN